MIQDTKERASDKIYSIYLGLMRKSLNPDLFWSIDKDRAKELMIAQNREIEVYSYILSLIEKDNKS
jgi:hypothetical protein